MYFCPPPLHRFTDVSMAITFPDRRFPGNMLSGKVIVRETSVTPLHQILATPLFTVYTSCQSV